MQGDAVDHRVETLEVPVGGPVDEAVNLVALLEQELGEIGTVLPADPGDQRRAHRDGSSTGSGENSRARS